MHRTIPVVTASVFWVFEDLLVIRLPYFSDEWSWHVLPDQLSKTPRMLSIFCAKEILSGCPVTSIANNFLSSSEREFVHPLADHPFQSLSSWRLQYIFVFNLFLFEVYLREESLGSWFARFDQFVKNSIGEIVSVIFYCTCSFQWLSQWQFFFLLI